MAGRTYGPEEQAKLKRIIDEGANVLSEVEDLNSGLKDTVKAVAEELEIKPSLINKAIKIAHKYEMSRHERSRAMFGKMLHIISIHVQWNGPHTSKTNMKFG